MRRAVAFRTGLHKKDFLGGAMHKTHRKLTYLILSALFAALISVGAFLKIPAVGVQMTMQTLFVLLAGEMLGAKYGALSVLLYLAMGLLGLPVFTKGGGPAYVLEPSFGYLLGFVPCALLSGHFMQNKTHIGKLFLSAVLSLFPVYLLGVAHLYLISRFYLGRSVQLFPLLTTGMLIFLPVDVLSCFVSAWITKIVRPNIRRYL